MMNLIAGPRSLKVKLVLENSAFTGVRDSEEALMKVNSSLNWFPDYCDLCS